MTRHYHVLPAADQDLDDQAAYLATEASLETGLRFYDATSITFGKIASIPSIGKRWPSADQRLAGLRVWRVEGFEKYLIFYRTTDTGIEIIRIIHAARDINRVLESGSPQ
jgi:toxin ParE1/3/4